MTLRFNTTVRVPDEYDAQLAEFVLLNEMLGVIVQPAVESGEFVTTIGFNADTRFVAHALYCDDPSACERRPHGPTVVRFPAADLPDVLAAVRQVAGTYERLADACGDGELKEEYYATA